MKIVILVAGLPPVYNGGTEVATTYIAKYAAKAGHEVRVLALDGTSKGKEVYVSEDGYRVHRIRTVQVPYLYGLCGLPTIIEGIREIHPDIVHAQSMQMGLSAYVAHKLYGCPYIMYGRGEAYMDWFLKDRMSRIIMASAERVIAQTQDMKNEMLKCIQRDIEVIPNGIDGSMVYQGTKLEARDDLHIGRPMKIALWVGRDRPEKNLKGFIDAMDILYKQGISGIAVGQCRDAYSKWLGCLTHNVSFAGDQPHSNIPAYMAAADVLVNTSFSEGFPMTLLEGMANGLPIVAPDVGGIEEIVGRGGTFTDGSAGDTALAVSDIIKTKEMADNMSDYNRDRAKQYSWDNVVKRLYG